MQEIILAILAIIVLWLLTVTYYLYRTVASYRKLMDGLRMHDLAGVVNSVLSRTEGLESLVAEVRKHIDKESLKSAGYIQKIGLVRYNPFSDTGGDQSFILSILDGKNDGVVLTSMHTRGITRWYAKNVREGKGYGHDLSKEEILSITSAKGIHQ